MLKIGENFFYKQIKLKIIIENKIEEITNCTRKNKRIV